MASRLQDVILRGTRASQPASTTVAPGTLYYVTDEGVTERNADDMSAWEDFTDTGGSGSVGPPGPQGIPGNDAEEAFEYPGIPGPPGNSVALTTAQKTRSIAIVIDGGGVAITTGVKVDFRFPVDGTIIKNSLLADQVGSIVLDIWKDTFANYPPTVADTITAAAKPTLSADDESEDSTLTGWTTSVSAGDCFRINVDSAATITRVTLVLDIVVT